MAFEDSKGRVLIEVDIGSRKLGKCSIISWSYYLGLVERELKICFENEISVSFLYDGEIETTLIKRN